MKKAMLDLYYKIINSKAGRKCKKWYAKLSYQILRPYVALKKEYYARKSARLERKWIEQKFMFGIPQSSSKFSNTPIKTLDQLIRPQDTGGVSLADLQADIVVQTAKMKGTPTPARLPITTKAKESTN